MEENTQLELLIQKVIASGKSKGLTFKSDTEARNWASNRIKRDIEKDRLGGHLIVCPECKESVCNKYTGPFLKYKKGNEIFYCHQNCVKGNYDI